MKKLEELGISPAPWTVPPIDNDFVISANGDNVCQVQWIAEDANLIAAAPKLYSKAYEVADNLLVHLAMPSQTINMTRAEVASMVNDLRSALAEAAGESEVEK